MGVMMSAFRCFLGKLHRGNEASQTSEFFLMGDKNSGCFPWGFEDHPAAAGEVNHEDSVGPLMR